MTNNSINDWYLSTALSHMSNYSNIDKRTLYLTFHLVKGCCKDRVSRDVYNFIKKVLRKGKTRLPLKFAPAMISSLDYEGSKEGRYTTHNPHIHMLAVAGQPLAAGQLETLINQLYSFLNKHPDVNKSFKNPIKITAFEVRPKHPIIEQFRNIIDYNRKGRLGDDREFALVLPYHDIMDNKTASNDNLEPLKKKLENRSESIRKDFGDVKQLHKYYSKAV